MATLETDTTNRISTKRLVQLTNPEVGTATTVNTTLLALAVTDVQADFQLLGGAAYDAANPIHVSVGITGVIAKLHEWTGNGGEWAMAHRELWYKNIALLRMREALIPPTTSGDNLTITRETSGSTPRTNSSGGRAAISWGSRTSRSRRAPAR